ncbi:hypothetical protein N7478_009420 [Penicillium angulare]|uniref:uncharacterized protein n=1 Tax=Penicillium angulare TaxID=116970 RepID=UPI0025419CFF|nr:uncharacterized protein N7478_009420 [Penicillium angulare]KAJ5266612.1 hypothetical protein N7478_009420 [Penicillium angulare]
MSQANDDWEVPTSGNMRALSDFGELSDEELVELAERETDSGLRMYYLRMLLRSRGLDGILNERLEQLTAEGEQGEDDNEFEVSFGILPRTAVNQQMIDSSVECPICLCPPELGACVSTLQCGHLFDTTCIVRWLTQHDTCPLCRQSALLMTTIQFNRGLGEGNEFPSDGHVQERHVRWA